MQTTADEDDEVQPGSPSFIKAVSIDIVPNHMFSICEYMRKWWIFIIHTSMQTHAH